MNDQSIILANSAPERLVFAATGTVEIEAEAATDGKPKQATFKINAYNGGPMQLAGWFNPVIIDLAGMKAMSQTIPILLNHETDRIVGQTRKVSIDAEGVNLAGVVTGAADDPDVAKVVGHSKGGFKWQASIGANPTRREFLEAGKTAQVNGRQVAGPLIIARESVLFETSFVAIGADITTSADIAASHSNVKDYDMNFEQWLKAKGVDITKQDDAAKAVMKAAFDAEVKAASAPATPPAPPAPTAPINAATTDLDAILAASRAESTRRSAIADMTAKVAKDRPDLADDLKVESDKALAGTTTVEQYQLTMIRIAQKAPNVIASRSAQVTNEPEVIEAAVALSTGLNNPAKHYSEQTLNAAQRQFKHGIGLLELLQIAASQSGYRGPARASQELLRAAFAPASMRAAGFSSVSLPDILSNVANKFVAQSFDAVEQSWRTITRTRPVKDFKQTTSVTLTGDFTFIELPPGGEIKHAVPGDESYTNQAKTYARKLAVTRQDLINDDLGALTAAPSRLGRGAALKLNLVFWTAFMDNATFFTAARGNYDEDTDTALALTGLGLADTLFRNLTDPDGNPMGLAWKYLLVPNALAMTAKALQSSTEIRDTTTSTKYPTSNPFAGNFETVVSSYLGNSSISGYSTTAYYLIANPMDMPVIETVFLNGQERPTIESADADFDQLGIQMRGYYDFGVAKQEYRAGVKMAGVNV